jgi:hypothetical protein
MSNYEDYQRPRTLSVQGECSDPLCDCHDPEEGVTLEEALAVIRYSVAQITNIGMQAEANIELSLDDCWELFKDTFDDSAADAAEDAGDAEGVFPSTEVTTRVLRAAIKTETYNG